MNVWVIATGLLVVMLVCIVVEKFWDNDRRP